MQPTNLSNIVYCKQCETEGACPRDAAVFEVVKNAALDSDSSPKFKGTIFTALFYYAM